jgi:hypothetical protein
LEGGDAGVTRSYRPTAKIQLILIYPTNDTIFKTEKRMRAVGVELEVWKIVMPEVLRFRTMTIVTSESFPLGH